MLKLIVGLGNPGKDYHGSRHNVGFRVVSEVAEEYNIKRTFHKHNALIAKGMIEKQKVILAQPTTYMNNSGKAVIKLLNYYKINREDMIIIYDDMDLETGTIRIKKRGSSGGHNGLKSVINHLKTDEFPRLRIGIGHPGENIDVVDYVLGKFTVEEEKTIENTIKKAVTVIKEIYLSGIVSAMNKYN